MPELQELLKGQAVLVRGITSRVSAPVVYSRAGRVKDCADVSLVIYRSAVINDSTA